MDSIMVDEIEIVKIIKSEGIPTFKLVSVAYGTKLLDKYAQYHPLSSYFWAGVFTDNKTQGTLKDHLTHVLSSDNINQIHAYIDAI
jgi:hypothetical protein